jgi:predicted GNAT family acetyltransferase
VGNLSPQASTATESNDWPLRNRADGEVAYLECSLSGNILELTRTEVPQKLRQMGFASSLAENALDWAGEHNLKVDIVCSTVREYVAKHPENSHLVMH